MHTKVVSYKYNIGRYFVFEGCLEEITLSNKTSFLWLSLMFTRLFFSFVVLYCNPSIDTSSFFLFYFVYCHDKGLRLPVKVQRSGNNFTFARCYFLNLSAPGADICFLMRPPILYRFGPFQGSSSGENVENIGDDIDKNTGEVLNIVTFGFLMMICLNSEFNFISNKNNIILIVK